jgi:hypothetical protein
MGGFQRSLQHLNPPELPIMHNRECRQRAHRLVTERAACFALVDKGVGFLHDQPGSRP